MRSTDLWRGSAPGAVVEVATWRPLEVVDVDGWQAGRSGGFTRRANSVLPLRAPGDVGRALARVARLYAPGQVVVRVDGGAQPAGLDALLAARGFARVAPTLVMVRGTSAADDGTEPPPSTAVTTSDRPDDAWVAGWLGVKAARSPVDASLARAVLSTSPASYLAAYEGDTVVGVLRAAYADGWVGLSSLVVVPAARRRGVARALTCAALAQARRRGVGRAFLQVEEGNAAARALYAGLGFVVADAYHYRER